MLIAIGEPISSKDHINVILEGLPEEYESLVSSISTRSRDDPVSVAEVEALLLAKESRLLKLQKASQSTIFSANVARALQITKLIAVFRLLCQFHSV
jgi:histone deacetylase 1/2